MAWVSYLEDFDEHYDPSLPVEDQIRTLRLREAKLWARIRELVDELEKKERKEAWMQGRMAYLESEID